MRVHIAPLAAALLLAGTSIASGAAADPVAIDPAAIDLTGPDAAAAPPRRPPRPEILDGEIGPWLLFLRGKVRKDGDGLSGVHLARSELGLDRRNLGLGFDGLLRLPGAFVALAEFADFTSRGSSVPADVVSFDGRPLPQGVPLRTVMRLTTAALLLQHPLWHHGAHWIDGEVGVRSVWARVTMSQDGQHIEAGASAPILLAGVASRHELGDLGWGPVTARFAWRWGHWSTFGLARPQKNWSMRLGAWLSIPVGGRVGPGERPPATLRLGYQYLFLDLERFSDGDKQDIDFELQGPSIALALEF